MTGGILEQNDNEKRKSTGTMKRRMRYCAHRIDVAEVQALVSREVRQNFARYAHIR